MLKLIVFVLFFLLPITFHPTPAYSDTLTFKNGSTLDGTVVKETNDEVTLEIEGGTMSFKRSDLLKVEKNKSVFVPVEIGPPPVQETEQIQKISLSPLRTYVHPVYRYSIRYPAQWEVSQGDKDVSFYWQDSQSPRGPGGMLAVAVSEGLSAADLNEFQREALKQMQTMDPSIRLLRQGATTVAEFPASLMVYVSRANGTRKMMQAYSLSHESRGYHFTFVADSKAYDKYLARVESVINSFSLKPPLLYRVQDFLENSGFSHPYVAPVLLGVIALLCVLSSMRVHRGTIMTLSAVGLLLVVGSSFCDALLEGAADYQRYGLYGVGILLYYGLMRRVNWARLVLLAATGAATFAAIFALISFPFIGRSFLLPYLDAFLPHSAQKGFLFAWLLYSMLFFHYFRRAGISDWYHQMATSRQVKGVETWMRSDRMEYRFQRKLVILTALLAYPLVLLFAFGVGLGVASLRPEWVRWLTQQPVDSLEVLLLGFGIIFIWGTGTGFFIGARAKSRKRRHALASALLSSVLYQVLAPLVYWGLTRSFPPEGVWVSAAGCSVNLLSYFLGANLSLLFIKPVYPEPPPAEIPPAAPPVPEI